MEFEGDREVRVDTEISADGEAIGVPLAKNDSLALKDGDGAVDEEVEAVSFADSVVREVMVGASLQRAEGVIVVIAVGEPLSAFETVDCADTDGDIVIPDVELGSVVID